MSNISYRSVYSLMKKVDVLIIGAGVAGLMCAIEAGKRKRKTLVLDHANKVGKKILMSGGGRCNFTNYYIDTERYISNNPHFHKSALSRYTQWDFIELVKRHKIPFHEKIDGQLFCDNKAVDIVNLLLKECEKVSAKIQLNTSINTVTRLSDKQFCIITDNQQFLCESLVIATGGLSIPTMGATPFGYKLAEQFGLMVMPTRAGLVPFTLQPEDKQRLASLTGVSVASVVSSVRQTFAGNILFTHRGLSGPAILQISSYWRPGEAIEINLLPQRSLQDEFNSTKHDNSKQHFKNFLCQFLPKSVVAEFIDPSLLDKTVQEISKAVFNQLVAKLQAWQIKPNNTEGYRTAEVTIGGVDCHAISSKTMMVRDIPRLYFIGEVLDVTGWLGGYNFQWAWSSGWVAGQVV